MGKLIVITAPSGAVKKTIVRHLVKTFDFLGFSISATTREKRNYELDGKDYHFVDISTFKNMINNGEFIEYMEFNSWYYGQTEIDFDSADVMIMSKDGLDMLPKKYRDQYKRARKKAAGIEKRKLNLQEI